MSKKRHAFVHDNQWTLPVCAVAEHYTVDEAAMILDVRPRWLEDKIDQGWFKGPASTEARPVDHKALMRYLGDKELGARREGARRQLLLAFAEQIPEEDDDDTTGD